MQREPCTSKRSMMDLHALPSVSSFARHRKEERLPQANHCFPPARFWALQSPRFGEVTRQERGQMEFIVRNSLFLITLVVVTGATCTGGLARPHSTDPMDWIIQHVCADRADKPVPADPYYGCPAGTSESRLKLGRAIAVLQAWTSPMKDVITLSDFSDATTIR